MAVDLARADLQRYRLARYADGGRGPDTFDCWGLVRDVYAQCGVELASHGAVSPGDKGVMTRHYNDIVGGFERCVAGAGAVACGYIGAKLWHVGVCIDARTVLHASSESGISCVALADFKRCAGLVVRFFEYAN